MSQQAHKRVDVAEASAMLGCSLHAVRRLASRHPEVIATRGQRGRGNVTLYDADRLAAARRGTAPDAVTTGKAAALERVPAILAERYSAAFHGGELTRLGIAPNKVAAVIAYLWTIGLDALNVELRESRLPEFPAELHEKVARIRDF